MVMEWITGLTIPEPIVGISAGVKGLLFIRFRMYNECAPWDGA